MPGRCLSRPKVAGRPARAGRSAGQSGHQERSATAWNGHTWIAAGRQWLEPNSSQYLPKKWRSLSSWRLNDDICTRSCLSRRLPATRCPIWSMNIRCPLLFLVGITLKNKARISILVLQLSTGFSQWHRFTQFAVQYPTPTLDSRCLVLAFAPRFRCNICPARIGVVALR